ncbi:MAG: hypothetical protein KBT03_08005 [Bacteroidales bacterium]|nr:hypothetical protein [Candidatus Scybalousia scybalohippi]
MRLISQDGYSDFQYENTMLEVGCIDAYKYKPEGYPIFATFHNQTISIAHYSSLEKCLKVMEMVRSAYTGSSLTVFKDYSMEETKEFMEVMKKSNAVILESGNKQPEFHHCVVNTVFQFPQDEDVTI